MKSKFFWQVPECIKFRVVFENEETVFGVNEKNEYRLFRKDTKNIGFSEKEAFEISFNRLKEKAEACGT